MKTLALPVLALVVFLATACVTGGRSVEYVGALRVNVQDFNAKTVRLYCGGVQQTVIRGLTMGKSHVARLRGTCHSFATLVVEYMGGQQWVSQPFQWAEGQTITLDVGVRPNYNFLKWT